MKVVVTTLVTLAGVVLAVPFVAAALLIGAGAVAPGEGGAHSLLPAGLVLCGALFSGLRGLGGRMASGAERHVLRVAHFRARPAQPHLPQAVR